MVVSGFYLSQQYLLALLSLLTCQLLLLTHQLLITKLELRLLLVLLLRLILLHDVANFVIVNKSAHANHDNHGQYL